MARPFTQTLIVLFVLISSCQLDFSHGYSVDNQGKSELPIELSADNWDHYVSSSKPMLVMFYAPWCGFCKQMKPLYNRLAGLFRNSDVVIARLDADEHSRFVDAFKITGFPTIIYFPLELRYEGDRTVRGMAEWLKEKATVDVDLSMIEDDTDVEEEADDNDNEDIPAVSPAVVQLDMTKFLPLVGYSQHVLVEFYADWCGHCKSFAPEYDKVADSLRRFHKQIVVSRVNAAKEETLKGIEGISKFPTLRLYLSKGVGERYLEYNGEHTADRVLEWVGEKTGIVASNVVIPSKVVNLTAKNFDEHMTGERTVVVMFYAPWCPFCERFTPTWEQLGRVFRNEEQVLVSRMDAVEYAVIARSYGGTHRYPTIALFEKGSFIPILYKSGRGPGSPPWGLGRFVSWINKHARTHRTLQGGLDPDAGRHKELDVFASRLTRTPDYDARARIVEDLIASARAVQGLSPTAQRIYVSIAEKVLVSASYIFQEKERVVKLLESTYSMDEKRRDTLQIRANILEAFQK